MPCAARAQNAIRFPGFELAQDQIRLGRAVLEVGDEATGLAVSEARVAHPQRPHAASSASIEVIFTRGVGSLAAARSRSSMRSQSS